MQVHADILDPTSKPVIQNAATIQVAGDVQRLIAKTMRDFRTQFPGESLMTEEGKGGYTLSVY